MSGGRRFDSVVEAIGRTPLVGIQLLSPVPEVRLFAKLEGHNPTGSVKDRIGKALIDDLEASGRLKPGMRILEATSGNTGISVALVAMRRGYPVTLVMADNVAPERRQLVQAYGAEIIDSPGELGSNGAVAKARALAAADPSYVMADQYGNEANSRAHEASTGPEILEDCPEMDVFVAGLGTAGTLMGVSRFLRRAKPGTRVVAAEPLPGAGIQGLRSLLDGFVPEIFDPSLLDETILVSKDQALQGVQGLLSGEGIFAGLSSGAALVAAQHAARDLGSGTVVVLLPDGGWKYLSAGIFSAPPA